MKIPVVRPEDIWDARGLRESTLLLDVRTPAEFREVHIPGSVNIPLGQVEQQKAAILEQASDGDVAIVCHTKVRSVYAYHDLEQQGVGNIAILRGGIAKWIESGLPVLRAEKSISVERQVRIVAGSLVVLGVLLSALVSPWFLFLPGVVGGGLVFAGATDTCWLATALARLSSDRPD